MSDAPVAAGDGRVTDSLPRSTIIAVLAGMAVALALSALVFTERLAFGDESAVDFLQAQARRFDLPGAHRFLVTSRAPVATGRRDRIAQKRAAHGGRAGKSRPNNPSVLRLAGISSRDAAPLPRRSVCVRACDGYFFPIAPLADGGDVSGHEAVCSSLCPGAQMSLFVMPAGSDDMNNAVSLRTSKLYAALPSAYRHTQTATRSCSCQPSGLPVRAVSILKDFTLRRGDSVMTEAGVRVFHGAVHWPYRRDDFHALSRSQDIQPAAKTSLMAMEKSYGYGRKQLIVRAPPAPTLLKTVTRDIRAPLVRNAGVQAMVND